MSKRLKLAAINGFMDPFRLTISLISAVVAVIAAFASHQPLDRQPSPTRDGGAQRRG